MSEKRKAAPAPADKRAKNSSGGYKKQWQKKGQLAAGMTGFLIFCPQHRERESVGDAYRIISNYLENEKESKDEPDKELSLEEELEAELKQMKEESKDRVLKQFEVSTKGICFIRYNSKEESEEEETNNKNQNENNSVAKLKTTDDTKDNDEEEAKKSNIKNQLPITPEITTKTVDIAHQILSDVALTKVTQSRYISRILPVTMTCKATIDSIVKTCELIFPRYFYVPQMKPVKFAIFFNKSHHETLKRDDVISAVAKLVVKDDFKHTVSLSEPDLSIMIHLIKNICCISVIEDFQKFKKYNLQSLLE